MYKNAEDESVICPYNRYHVISKLKIQKHLIKCKKNHPDVKLATCFYNYTHRLRPEDMLEHYEVCPYKARVEGARYESHTGSGSVRGSNSQEYLSCPGSLKSLSIAKKQEEFRSNTFTGGASKFRNFESLKPVIYKKSNIFKEESEQPELHEIWDDDDDDDDIGENIIEDCDADDSIFNVDEDDIYDEDDDDLEPLPLPKTTSKAFTCALQNSPVLNSKSQVVKGFGRSKNFLTCNHKKVPRSHDHLIGDISDMESILSKDVSSKLFLSSAYTSCSELSDTYDECTTLKSDDVSVAFDEDGFILKDLDCYVKI